MEVLDLVQGDDAWFQARLGIPTASRFSTVLAKGRGGGESKTRSTYMRQLAGERLTGEPMESFSNSHMERGTLLEPEARMAYELLKDVEVAQTGFVKNHGAGASPDGLIGGDGLLEIKCKYPAGLIEYHERGEIPPEHVAQVQGQLWVTDRIYCDFVGYCPGMPTFITRVERDEDYIATLADEVAQFNAELDRMVEKLRGLF